MRVLHVIDSGGLYGAEIMLLHLMVAQRDFGVEPLLASIGVSGEAEKPLEREARRRGLRVRALRMRAGLNWPGALDIVRLARDERISLLHSHGYKGNILLGLLPGGVRRLPLVVTVHGWTATERWSRLRVYEWLDGLSLRQADRVVLVSGAMRRHPRVSAMARNKLAVVANGVALSVSRKDHQIQPRIREFSSQGMTLGAVGRLSREKGFDLLLHAFAELLGQGHELRLVILGEGEQRGALEELARSLGIGERLLLPGYLDHARQYLGLFDLFVLPSLTEGLPLVLLEAMAAGAPVVATRVGAVAEVLDQGRAGWLAGSGSVASLRDAIAQALDQPLARRARAAIARNRVAENYSCESMARGYFDVYQDVLAALPQPQLQPRSRRP